MWNLLQYAQVAESVATFAALMSHALRGRTGRLELRCFGGVAEMCTSLSTGHLIGFGGRVGHE